MNELSGSSLEEQAASLGSEVADFDGITLNSYFADGIGYEPRVMGAISTTGQGVVSAPVKGRRVFTSFGWMISSRLTNRQPRVRRYVRRLRPKAWYSVWLFPLFSRWPRCVISVANISNRTTNRLLQTFRAGALMLPARIFCAFASVLLRGRSVAAVFSGRQGYKQIRNPCCNFVRQGFSLVDKAILRYCCGTVILAMRAQWRPLSNVVVK